MIADLDLIFNNAQQSSLVNTKYKVVILQWIFSK